MAELRGTLTESELLPLIRFLADLRRTGSLYISQDAWAAHLDFLDGRLADVAFRDERGLGAITALASALTQADFEYADRALSADILLGTSPDGYELPPAAGVLPLDAVPQRINVLSETAWNTELVFLTRSTIRSLVAVDGQRTIRDILSDGSGSARMLDLLKLRDQGLISIDAVVAPQLPAAPRQTQHAVAAPVAEVDSSIAEPPSPAIHRPTEPTIDDRRNTCGGCPMLGLAEDPSSHFGRPTALHRCHADGTGQPVTNLQQRDLCLTDTYSRCSRLSAASGRSRSVGAGVAPALIRPDDSRPDVTIDTPGASGPHNFRSNLWPVVSIGMAIAAVIANILVFVRPHFA
jgi:hypothetical protein